MDKNLARQMAFLLRQSSDLLVHLLWLVEQHGTEEEYLQHQKAVAHVLTELGAALLYPIYHQYPDLEPVLPPDWKSEEKQTSTAPNLSDEAPSVPEDPKGDP